MARLHKTVMARKLKQVSQSASESDGSDAEMEDYEDFEEQLEEDEETEPTAPRKHKPVGDHVDDIYAAVRATQGCASLSTYNAALPDAPNPCMHISGSGLVPLPLTMKDAQGIATAASAAQADDQGASTTRGYWEISRDGVLFGNPKFEAYLESTVLPPLTTQLSLDWGAKPVPNLSFEKLVLCELDFYLPLSSDEQNPDGEIVLAQLLVILPSHHTGGDVKVADKSKPQKSKVCDISAHSLYSTSVFAWSSRGTATRPEFEPITSGFRLALLFNLTQPLPLNASQVLKKWRNGEYRMTEMNYPAFYVLGRRYTAKELEKGDQCLDEVDAQVVNAFRDAASEHGFTLSLGDVKHSNCGSKCTVGYYGPGEPQGDWDEESTKETFLLSAVDLKGAKIFSPETLVDPKKGVSVDDSHFIPPDPFSQLEADEGEREGGFAGYTSPGNIYEWDLKYYRTVLITNPGPDFDDLCYEDQGASYIFKCLESFKERGIKKTDPKYAKWTTRAVEKYTKWNSPVESKDKPQHCTWSFVSHIPERRSTKWMPRHTEIMYRFSLDYEDDSLLSTILPSKIRSLEDLDTIREPWGLFGFEKVRPGLEGVISKMALLKDRIELIQKVPAYSSPTEVEAVELWCKTELSKVFESYHARTNADDIPLLVSLMQSKDWTLMQDLLIPGLLQSTQSATFLVDLIKALEILCMDLPDDPEAGEIMSNTAPQLGITKHQAQEFISLLRSRLPHLWADGKPKAEECEPHATIKILETLVPHPSSAHLVEALLTDILRKLSPVDGPGRRQFYIPLVTDLTQLLAKHNIPPYSPPYVDLFRILIGAYMAMVHVDKAFVGSKPNRQVRHVGCNKPTCTSCITLNVFMKDETRTSLSFDSIAAAEGAHIVSAFVPSKKKKRLCNVEIHMLDNTGGRMVRASVVKLDDVHDSQKWVAKKATTKKFLSQFSDDDEVLKKIMGDNWDTFVIALSGNEKFPKSKIGYPLPQQTGEKRKADDADADAGASVNEAGQPSAKVRRL